MSLQSLVPDFFLLSHFCKLTLNQILKGRCPIWRWIQRLTFIWRQRLHSILQRDHRFFGRLLKQLLHIYLWPLTSKVLGNFVLGLFSRRRPSLEGLSVNTELSELDEYQKREDMVLPPLPYVYGILFGAVQWFQSRRAESGAGDAVLYIEIEV